MLPEVEKKLGNSSHPLPQPILNFRVYFWISRSSRKAALSVPQKASFIKKFRFRNWWTWFFISCFIGVPLMLHAISQIPRASHYGEIFPDMKNALYQQVKTGDQCRSAATRRCLKQRARPIRDVPTRSSEQRNKRGPRKTLLMRIPLPARTWSAFQSSWKKASMSLENIFRENKSRGTNSFAFPPAFCRSIFSFVLESDEKLVGISDHSIIYLFNRESRSRIYAKNTFSSRKKVVRGNALYEKYDLWISFSRRRVFLHLITSGLSYSHQH